MKAMAFLAAAALAAAYPAHAGVLSHYTYDVHAPGIIEHGGDQTDTSEPIGHRIPNLVSIEVETDYGEQRVAAFSVYRQPASGIRASGVTAASRWWDTFVIMGGTGRGTASYEVALAGAPRADPQSTPGLPFAQVLLIARSPADIFGGIQYQRTLTEEIVSGATLASGRLMRAFEFVYGERFTIESEFSVSAHSGGAADYVIATGIALPPGASLVGESGAPYPPPPDPRVDLDIQSFTVAKAFRLSRPRPLTPSVAIRNAGVLSTPVTVRLVGEQRGSIVYSQTDEMVVPARRTVKPGYPPFAPSATGDITWRVTVYDGNADRDIKTAVTRVSP